MVCYLRCRFSRRWVDLLVIFLLSLPFLLVLYLAPAHSVLNWSSQTQAALWIVPVTSVPLTPTIVDLPAGWTLFVPKGSQFFGCSACVQQGDSLDQQLGRWNHGIGMASNSPLAPTYTRMATVLFLLKHGATSILFISDVTSAKKSLRRLLQDNQPDGVKGVEYYGSSMTLDSEHFHHRANITLGNPCQYRIRLRMNPLWTVGVRCRASRQPRMDAPILIDEHAPPVFTPVPRFSIMTFEDSLFHHDGIWAMFSAFVSSGEPASVWGIWAQRLLQEIAAEMALISLECPEISHSITMPKEISSQSQAAFKLASGWVCPSDAHFWDCAVGLAKDFKKQGYVSTDDIAALKVWIEELRSLGYPEPKRQKTVPRTKDILRGCIIYSPALVVPHNALQPSVNSPIKLFPHIEERCKNLSKRQGVKDPFQLYKLKDESKVKDIALVVIFFDATIYRNIQYLEDLHRKYFPYLIYCGPEANLFIAFYKNFKSPMTYIEVPDTKGFVAYECISRAIMMNYDVQGYLEIADDVILNTWTLTNIPRDKFWFQKDLHIGSRFQQTLDDFALSYSFPWWPWTVHGQMWGAKAMAKVWHVFDHIHMSTNTGAKGIVKTFLDILKHNSGKSENFFFSSSDIFYVPSQFRQTWAMLSEIFFKNNVFLDIAVPTLMNGMDLTSNIVRLEGIYLWYNERSNYPSFYRDFHHFFHPWKTSWINRFDHANFLCYYVLPSIVTDLTTGQAFQMNNSSHSVVEVRPRTEKELDAKDTHQDNPK